MALRINDFKCPDGHVHEAMHDAEVTMLDCPTCGKLASKMIGAPRAVLEPFSGSFPGAAMAWEARREQHMRWEQKQKASKGDQWYVDRIKS